MQSHSFGGCCEGFLLLSATRRMQREPFFSSGKRVVFFHDVWTERECVVEGEREELFFNLQVFVFKKQITFIIY